MPTPPTSSMDIPILVLVIAFVGGLLGLAGWVLSVERRKLDKREFEMYSSKLESRLQVMATDITNRITKLYDISKEERIEILREMRELRSDFLHHFQKEQ